MAAVLEVPGSFRPFETFLENWLTNNQQQRIVETGEQLQQRRSGDAIVAPLINDALDG